MQPNLAKSSYGLLALQLHHKIEKRKKRKTLLLHYSIFSWLWVAMRVYVKVFVGLAYYQGKDIVFRSIIEYSSLRDFGS
jgi:hypothetical protein